MSDEEADPASPGSNALLGLDAFTGTFDLEAFLLNLAAEPAASEKPQPVFEGPAAIGKAKTALERAHKLLATFQDAERHLGGLLKKVSIYSFRVAIYMAFLLEFLRCPSPVAAPGIEMCVVPFMRSGRPPIRCGCGEPLH